ncbi:uncharacterized protein RP688-like [Oculina patagonica]
MALQDNLCRIERHRLRSGLVVKAVCFIIVFTIGYLGVNFVEFARYKGTKPWLPDPPCFQTEESRAFLVELAYKTHLILDNMGLEHWLMYGSLWGPLRGVQGPLPWDFDVDYGVNASNEIFDKMNLEEFKAKFTAAGMKVTDKVRSKSSIALEANGTSVDLILFYDHKGYMTRFGYEPWLFYIHYRLYHTFPSRLVRPPLPKVKFGFFNVPVPREGIEIMKYLYRLNWWKVVKPVGCE